MKDKKDFKGRMDELFSENSSNEEIITKIRTEFKIYLTNDQIDNRRRRLSFESKIQKSNSIEDIIIDVLKTQLRPVSAQEICTLIKKKHDNLIISRREIRQIIWRQLIEKINYDKQSFRYSIKTENSDYNRINILDFFQIKKEVDLSIMTKSFIRRDSTFLNSGFKSLDKLINSYLYNSKVSEFDYIFLERKLEEHKLDLSTLKNKKSVKLKNFHKIEDLIHIIYEDHIIKDYELEYIKRKLEFNDIPDLIGNKRFWQISLFYYFDVLNKLSGFNRLLKLVYILTHIDLEEVKDTILSFRFINIYESNNIQDIIIKGNEILEKKLIDTIRKKHLFFDNNEQEVDMILKEIVDFGERNKIEKINTDKTDRSRSNYKYISQNYANKNFEKKIEKPIVKAKSITEILSQLSKEDSDSIINYVQKGNRLSAFFRYSNCMANKYPKKEIEQSFEEIWDNFS
jgi:hypothetical protein